jgi:hypothetical protein
LERDAKNFDLVQPDPLCNDNPGGFSSSMGVDMPDTSEVTIRTLSTNKPKYHSETSLHKNDALFCVPSSDNECSDQSPIYLPSKKKRRRIDQIKGNSHPDFVWDDQSLQRNITAQHEQEMSRLAMLTEIEVLQHAPQKLLQQKRHTIITQKDSRLSGAKASRLGLANRVQKPVLARVTGKQKYMNKPYSQSPSIEVIIPSAIEAEHARRPAVKLLSSRVTAGSRLKQTTQAACQQRYKETDFPVLISTTNLKRRSKTSLEQSPPAYRTTPSKADPQMAPKNMGDFPSPSQLNIATLHISNLRSIQAEAGQRASPSLSGYELQQVSARTKIRDRLHSYSHETESEDETDGTEDGTVSNNESDLRSKALTSIAMETGSSSVFNDCQSPKHTSQSASQSESSQLLGNILTRGPKVTYARQRSHLTEKKMTEAELLGIPVSHSIDTRVPSGYNTSYATKDRTETLLYLPGAMDDLGGDAQGSAVRSIHELRQAGGNARVAGEIEAIMDDIDTKSTSTLSIKRGALLDLAKKLQVPEFSRQFFDSGLESRLLVGIDPKADTIANMLFMIALLQILVNSCGQHMLQMGGADIVEFLSEYLNSTEDLIAMVKRRNSNISKALQADIKIFCGTLATAPLWKHQKPSQLTGRVLALQCLEYFVRQLRASDSCDDLLSRGHVDKLAHLLFSMISKASLSPMPDRLVEVQLTLSILESSTVISSLNGRELRTQWSDRSLESIAHLLPLMQAWWTDGAWEIKAMVLRLYLNLTNGSREICEVLSRLETIQAILGLVDTSFQELSMDLPEEQLDLLLDSLVLSLGLMINLVEGSEKCREIFVMEHRSYPIPLQTLLNIFLSRSQNSSEVWLYYRSTVGS